MDQQQNGQHKKESQQDGLHQSGRAKMTCFQTCQPIVTLIPFFAERQTGKL